RPGPISIIIGPSSQIRWHQSRRVGPPIDFDHATDGRKGKVRRHRHPPAHPSQSHAGGLASQLPDERTNAPPSRSTTWGFVGAIKPSWHRPGAPCPYPRPPLRLKELSLTLNLPVITLPVINLGDPGPMALSSGEKGKS